MKRFLMIFTIISIVLLSFCGGRKTVKGIERKTIKGVMHIFNPARPLKGTLSLQVEEIFRFNPSRINKKFKVEDFTRDSQKNIYLLDRKSFRIYKINRKGKVVATFLNKGEGPGEFKYLPRIYFRNGYIWATSMNKAVKYDTEGNIIKEATFTQFYWFILPAESDKFLGDYPERNKNGFKGDRLVLFGWNEKPIVTLLESKYIGMLFFNLENVNRAFVASTPVLPRPLYQYDPVSHMVYITESKDYIIYVKSLDGDTKIVIHRNFSSIPFSEKKKNLFLKDMGEAPEKFKIALKKNLPNYLCAISNIKALPGGYLMVMSTQDINKVSYDLFSPDGEFAYVLKFPEKISVNRSGKFYPDGTLGILEEEGNSEYYIEYRIKNLPEVFGK